MRITAYSLAMAVLFVLFTAFAGTPALADMKSEQMMEHSGVTATQKAKETGMKSKMQSEPSRERTGTFGKAATETETSAQMKGSEKSQVAPKSKLGGTGGREGRAPGERGLKSEAPIPGEKGRMDRPVRGGVAVVSSVDRPEDCLRIRSGPGTSNDVVACATRGEKLRLTGEFSRDGRWARIDDGGWVFYGQLDTEVRPPRFAAAEGSFDKPATAGKGKSRTGHKRFHRHGGPCYYYGTGYYGPYYYGGGYYGSFPRYSHGYGGGFYWYP